MVLKLENALCHRECVQNVEKILPVPIVREKELKVIDLVDHH